MIDQTWESIRVKLTELLVVRTVQLLKTDFEIHRTRTYHVLHLKLAQLHSTANARNGPGVVLGSVEAVSFALRAGNNHLARLEDERSRSLRLFHSHYYRSKTLRVVLGISTLVRNVLQVQLNAKTGSGHKVLKFRSLELCNLGLGLNSGGGLLTVVHGRSLLQLLGRTTDCLRSHARLRNHRWAWVLSLDANRTHRNLRLHHWTTCLHGHRRNNHW